MEHPPLRLGVSELAAPRWEAVAYNASGDAAPAERASHTATVVPLLSSGTLGMLVFGGISGGATAAALNDLHEFSFETLSWRALSPLGVAPSAARVDAIVAAASFAAMKARHESGDGGAALRHAGEAAHFRAGRAGGWREQLTGAQQQAVAAAIRARLAGSGLEGTWEGL